MFLVSQGLSKNKNCIWRSYWWIARFLLHLINLKPTWEEFDVPPDLLAQIRVLHDEGDGGVDSASEVQFTGHAVQMCVLVLPQLCVCLVGDVVCISHQPLQWGGGVPALCGYQHLHEAIIQHWDAQMRLRVER